jgi:hypothetical protein
MNGCHALCLGQLLAVVPVYCGGVGGGMGGALGTLGLS